MIYSIQRFYKPELTNVLHDEFMHECAEILLSVQITGNEVFDSIKKRFCEAFAEEEKWLKGRTADPALAELRKLSNQRKHTYSGMRTALKGIVMAQLPCAESARMLLKHFTSYQRDLNTSLEGQTAIIRSLLKVLAQPEAQQALADTQTMMFYDQLKQLNKQVAEQNKCCREYSSQYVKAALHKARIAMDAVYDEAVKRVEGLANTTSGVCEEAVSLWNASIRKYKQTLKDRKIARATAKRKMDEVQQELTSTAASADSTFEQHQTNTSSVDWALDAHPSSALSARLASAQQQQSNAPSADLAFDQHQSSPQSAEQTVGQHQSSPQSAEQTVGQYQSSPQSAEQTFGQHQQNAQLAKLNLDNQQSQTNPSSSEGSGCTNNRQSSNPTPHALNLAVK